MEDTLFFQERLGNKGEFPLAIPLFYLMPRERSAESIVRRAHNISMVHELPYHKASRKAEWAIRAER